MLQRIHSACVHVANNTKQAREEIKRQADKHVRLRQLQVGDPVFWHNHVQGEGHMKKLASPWRSHYCIIEMITPVTAVSRYQKNGTFKTVHVNNLRYAHINKKWDYNESTEEEEEEFPEQNTASKLTSQRRQPYRRTMIYIDH